jgi:hypothetical protein
MIREQYTQDVQCWCHWCNDLEAGAPADFLCVGDMRANPQDWIDNDRCAWSRLSSRFEVFRERARVSVLGCAIVLRLLWRLPDLASSSLATARALAGLRHYERIPVSVALTTMLCI